VPGQRALAVNGITCAWNRRLRRRLTRQSVGQTRDVRHGYDTCRGKVVATTVTRLAFVVAISILAAPLTVEAQLPAKVPRIGNLTGNLATGLSLREAFLQGLRDLGYGG